MKDITVTVVEGDYRVDKKAHKPFASDEPARVFLTDETEIIVVVPKGTPTPKLIVR